MLNNNRWLNWPPGGDSNLKMIGLLVVPLRVTTCSLVLLRVLKSEMTAVRIIAVLFTLTLEKLLNACYMLMLHAVFKVSWEDKVPNTILSWQQGGSQEYAACRLLSPTPKACSSKRSASWQEESREDWTRDDWQAIRPQEGRTQWSIDTWALPEGALTVVLVVNWFPCKLNFQAIVKTYFG